ncbi:hypothetical protein EXIGLDRAFT_708633 [Exidia glandulosa HHB12029]|uniref:Secreted protein n=1 Tax=Exidia glandulosa HHB12029 TaxID=1314781 RepID=A0A165PFI5_EXIGL|nr:hypothetical protein EXIGLDRAFT_708633 [Exidia glandulosa HHB12029]
MRGSTWCAIGLLVAAIPSRPQASGTEYPWKNQSGGCYARWKRRSKYGRNGRSCGANFAQRACNEEMTSTVIEARSPVRKDKMFEEWHLQIGCVNSELFRSEGRNK